MSGDALLGIVTVIVILTALFVGRYIAKRAERDAPSERDDPIEWWWGRQK